MRIGIDARMYGAKQTGIGIYIENLIKNILKLDDKNEYVLFVRNAPELESEDFIKKSNVKIVIADYSWYSFTEQLIFPFKIWREKLDLMHFPHFNAPIFCPVRFVVTIHDMTPKYYPGNKVGKSFFRRKMFDLVIKNTLLKSEKIIAVSNFTKNEILRFYPDISDEKIEVIHEGMREDFLGGSSASFQKYLQEGYSFEETGAGEKDWFCSQSRFFAEPVTGAAAGHACRQAGAANCGSEKLHPSCKIQPFIFYTGVWRNHKNLVGLIKAFKILKEKHKILHQLVLGGNEDPSYPEVRKTWEDLRLDKDIVLTGFLSLEDQIFLYQNCDLYVSPSFSEGFGFTPLEAMSQGAVVALSDISAHREIAGDLPVYFNPKDEKNMAEKIYFALSDKDFRGRIKIRGPEYVKKFQWQNCARETLTKVYKYYK